MAAINYLDFDLLIERAGDTYRARVTNSPAGQAATDFKLPFSDLELENFLLKMGRTRRGVRRLETQELEASKDFGAKLYQAVFQDEVRGVLRSSLDQAQRQNSGLRLRLSLTGASELANLPWEYLYLPSLNRFLALSDETPLIRFLDLPEIIRPLTVTPPLRVLAVISSPSDFEPLDVEREWNKVQSALKDLTQRGLVVVERLEMASLPALQTKLRQGAYHILHFVGHGGFDERAQDGVLVLQNENGSSRLVGAQTLGTILHDHRPLRLAVLNACEGARSSTTDPFAGVAQTLVQQRIPAVIAMQFEISDDAAITFAHEFYAALADGYPVDGALTEARKAIFAQGNEIEWGTPVLYLRAPDGKIFDVQPSPSKEEGAAAAATLGAATSPMPAPSTSPQASPSQEEETEGEGAKAAGVAAAGALAGEGVRGTTSPTTSASTSTQPSSTTSSQPSPYKGEGVVPLTVPEARKPRTAPTGGNRNLLLAGAGALVLLLLLGLLGLNVLGIFSGGQKTPEPTDSGAAFLPSPEATGVAVETSVLPRATEQATEAPSEVPTEDTGAPTAEPSPVQTTALTPDTGSLAPYFVTGFLEYGDNFDRWGSPGYVPQTIELSETKPDASWNEPTQNGIQRLYGTATFGDSTKMHVVLDVLGDVESEMYVAFNDDTDFADHHKFVTKDGSFTELIQFQVDYADGVSQKYAIRAYYPIDFAKSLNRHPLHYYRRSLREGTVSVSGTEYPLAIVDENNDAKYSDMADTAIFVDESGKIIESRADSPFSIDGTFYNVADISDSGGRITLARSAFGEVVGQVTDSQTGNPISGVTVVLSPFGASTYDPSGSTGPDGRFRIPAPQGVYRTITAKRDGYVPEYEGISETVKAGEQLTLDVKITPGSVAAAHSGVLKLEDGDSYHFLSGERSKYTGGDFYVSLSGSDAKFYANNFYQQGVAEIGDIGSKLPDNFNVAQSALSRFGVPAVAGHTYVSPAKEGEEGHYILFRVTNIVPNKYVEIEFQYH